MAVPLLAVWLGVVACGGEPAAAPSATSVVEPAAAVAVAETTATPAPVAPAPGPAASPTTAQAAPQAAPEISIPAPRPAAAPTATPVPEPIQIPQDFEARVDEFMSAYADLDRFSGAILVAQGDEILVSKGYGTADYERGISNTHETKFSLGQISRQFTAMAVMQLQERGLLLVDDPISTYLPDYPQGGRITLHDLLITTSGIPSYAFLPEFKEVSMSPTSVEELIALFKDEPLDNDPGQNLNFSGSGYVLLGYVIEKVSGMSYEAYIEENIFGPPGMSSSGYDINRPDIRDRAYGYLTLGDDPVKEDPIDMSSAYAAAGLYSTLEDLYKWDRALYTEELVSREAFEERYLQKVCKQSGGVPSL